MGKEQPKPGVSLLRWFRTKDRRRIHSSASTLVAGAEIDGPGELRQYDHDAVSDQELTELVGELAELMDSSAPALAVVEELDGDTGDTSGTPSHLSEEVPEQETLTSCSGPELQLEISLCIGPQQTEDCSDLDLPPADSDDSVDFEIPMVWQLDGPLPSTIDFDPPDFHETHIAVEERDTEFVSEVTDDQRARQQAIQFLSSIGELQARHVDWIADIILRRRWSAAQLRVLALWRSGCSIQTIYVTFQLSEAWRDVDAFDQRLDHGDANWSHWGTACRPRLSWREAAVIVDFCGEDSTLEDLIEFVEAERHVWRDSSALSERYPRFKDYLLQYRLTDECRRSALGWYRTLDPKDGRFFGGDVNPEYSLQCWEDRIHGSAYVVAVDRHIFNGGSLDSLLAVRSGDSDWLDWEE